MICEVAVATYTAPSQWWGEDDETIATVVEILDEIRRASK